MKALLHDAWTALRVRKASLFVAQGGLVLALTASLLVGLLATMLSAVDPELPEPERIVMLDFKGNPPGQPSDWFGASPLFFGPALQARGVPLDDLSRVQAFSVTLRTPSGPRLFNLALTDPALQRLMALRALHGDLASTLQRPDALAISTELVRRLWGDLAPERALGRSLTIREKSYLVTAVMPPFDARHPLAGHELLGGTVSQVNTASDEERDAIFLVNGRVFARLQAGVQAEQVGPWMREAFLAHPGYAKLPADWKAGREPAYFRAITLPQTRFEGGENQLRWVMLGALGAACALLVLMAGVNALNLQAAQLLQRQRETALRLSLGASRLHLLRLWATEQGLALLATGGLAWLLAWWAAPALTTALGLPPNAPLFDPLPWPLLIGLGGVLLALLVLTLSLPAWLALRQAPARALQGRTASEGPWGRRLRQTLLGLQLGGAVLLLALTGVLTLQHQHLQGLSHGYQLEGRLLLDVWARPDDAPRLQPLVQALIRDPQVQSWSYSSGVPGGGWNGTVEQFSRAAGGPGQAVLRVTQVSSGFFQTYGMTLLAGDPRSALRGEPPVVLDAHATRLLGFASPQAAVGALVLAGGEFMQAGKTAHRVVAVVADVKLESAREAAQPQAFVITDQAQPFLTLHGPDPVALQAAAERLWKQFDLPFFHILEEVAEQRRIAYQQEAHIAALLGVVALLSVVVAAVGAYALVADTLRRRRTELVLRRLHGADNRHIARAVLAEFVAPLLAALLCALPAAAVLGGLYLDGFVDRLPAARGLLPALGAAALVTTAVVALAALRHTRQAMALRPIEALA